MCKKRTASNTYHNECVCTHHAALLTSRPVILCIFFAGCVPYTQRKKNGEYCSCSDTLCKQSTVTERSNPWQQTQHGRRTANYFSLPFAADSRTHFRCRAVRDEFCHPSVGGIPNYQNVIIARTLHGCFILQTTGTNSKQN